ncbi:MAG: hypothetical protein V8S26_06105 [Lachnospiraceae bacterium]
MKKKIVTGMLIALALCSITACGKNKASSSAAQSASVVGAGGFKNSRRIGCRIDNISDPGDIGKPDTGNSRQPGFPDTGNNCRADIRRSPG